MKTIKLLGFFLMLILTIEYHFSMPEIKHKYEKCPKTKDMRYKLYKKSYAKLLSLIGKEENDYACYSFLGEFIQEMRKIEGVRMSSIQDIIKFKGSESPVSEIARSLETEAIIDGSFAFQNDLITLNQIISSPNAPRIRTTSTLYRLSLAIPAK